MRKILLTLSFIICAHFSEAQTLNPVSKLMQNDSIQYMIYNWGGMWMKVGMGEASYFYPANTTKSPLFAYHTWFASKSATADTSIAAMLYYQSGEDFFPGPLDSAGAISSAVMENWNFIWKVTRAEIENFYVSYGQAGFDINDSQWDNIRNWPGYGNTLALGATGSIASELSVPYKTSADFAPFVDLNGNGVYDPQNGDYPEVKGLETAWWIYNDAGGIKTSSNSPSMHIEIAAKSYIYSHHTILDNQSFYEYRVTNRSNVNLLEFIAAAMVDGDIGYFMDDYAGSDSALSIGYFYNADSLDGFPNDTNTYGTDMPISGMYFPGLVSNVESSTINSIVHWNNNNDGILGNPKNIKEYYNYMTAHTRNGQNYTQTCNTLDSGATTKFVYEISRSDQECICQNISSDRRLLINSYPITLPVDSSLTFINVAIIRNQNLICGETNPWQEVYDTITADIIDPPLAVSQIAPNSEFILSPVPAQEWLNIKGVRNIDLSKMNVHISTLLGQEVSASLLTKQSDQIQLDVSQLPTGVYILRLNYANKTYSKYFEKE